MMDPLPAGLAALEELVVQDPDSSSKRHDVLLEFLAFPDLHADPRRIDHVIPGAWLSEVRGGT